MIGIKDFGMPSCCVNCQMCDAYEKGMCVVTDTECEDMYSQRNDDCPLVEITESDDCVSREAVIELVKKGEYDITGKTDNEMFLEEVNKLPLVNPQNDVLDKIRAEIENDLQLKEFPCSPFSCGLRQALDIIDKYRVGNKE